MFNKIEYYKECRYETQKGGLFWLTYIYKKVYESEYELIHILRFLMEPNHEVIHKNIDLVICGDQ